MINIFLHQLLTVSFILKKFEKKKLQKSHQLWQRHINQKKVSSNDSNNQI